MHARPLLVIATTLLAPAICAQAQTSLPAPWDSVGRILQTTGTATAGYYRYGWPRRDITLRVGDVTVAPALALGAWAGFAGDSATATMMGDLVLTGDEVKPVLAELASQRIDVMAIHNHVVGDPQVTYVHFHADGEPRDLAKRLDRVLARTKTPRPVTAPPAQPLTVDTALVFSTLGLRGRAQGNLVLMSTVLVPGQVTMNGRVLNPAMAYGTPINIQVLAGGAAGGARRRDGRLLDSGREGRSRAERVDRQWDHRDRAAQPSDWGATGRVLHALLGGWFVKQRVTGAAGGTGCGALTCYL